MKTWVIASLISVASLANAQAQDVQQTGGFFKSKHAASSSTGCSTCDANSGGGSHSGDGTHFGGGNGGGYTHPLAYRPYGTLFSGHHAGQQLPVFQAAPWYLYFPYNAHFQTPAPIGGGYYPPPVMGGGYGSMPYFPGTSPMMSPQYTQPTYAPAQSAAPVVQVPASPTKMPIAIPPAK